MAATQLPPLLLHRSRSSRSDTDFGATKAASPPVGIGHHHPLQDVEPGEGHPPPRRDQRLRSSLPSLLPGKDGGLPALGDPAAAASRRRDGQHQLAVHHHHRHNHHQHHHHSHQLDQRHHSSSQRQQHQQPQLCSCSDSDGEQDGSGGRLTRRELREIRRQRIAAARFRKAIRLVRILVSWIRVLLKRKNYRDDESVKVVDSLKGFSSEDSDLTFDLTYFRAKREIDLTGEMKAILQLEPQDRTTEQVQTVMFGLQSLPTFNEYPLRTQEKLARVAFYQSVPAGRLIIRQGHIGICFYIIIRGRVLVSVMSEDRRTGETRTNIVARLGQGQSFGEVALLRQVTRTASVVSQEPAQLLVIGREEFNEIFARPEPGRLLPGHMEFLASCGFMRSFPVPLLLEHPGACLLTFYRRNALIAPDSKTHPYLVVVRSGSCRVVKNLRLPALGEEIFGEEGVGDDQPPSCGNGVLECEEWSRALRLPNVIEPKVDSWRTNNHPSHRRRHAPPQAFAVASTTSMAASTTTTDHHRRCFSENQRQLQLVALQSQPMDTRRVVEVARQKPPLSSTPERPTLTRPQEETVVAVQVSTLKPGDVFGLSDVLFKGENNPDVEASASVALVSNGAECVLLSKAFFVAHADERVRRDVRGLARPFPTEAVFAGNYRCQAAWDRYRRRLFRDTLREIAARGSHRSGSC